MATSWTRRAGGAVGLALLGGLSGCGEGGELTLLQNLSAFVAATLLVLVYLLVFGGGVVFAVANVVRPSRGSRVWGAILAILDLLLAAGAGLAARELEDPTSGYLVALVLTLGGAAMLLAAIRAVPKAPDEPSRF